MKKILCMLMAATLIAAMLTAGACALAEEDMEDVIDRFSDTWVSDSLSVEIWADDDDGAFLCSAVFEDGTICEYDTCHYEEENDRLVCEDGVRAYYTYNEVTLVYDKDVVAEGLSATFSFQGNAQSLVFDDGKQQIPLQRLSDAEEAEYEEAQSYIGHWSCERATIEIADNEDGSYAVNIVWGSSASEQVEWRYECVYDGIVREMCCEGTGVKAVVTYGENGATFSAKEEYSDGTAFFFIDGAGRLHWEDEKEDVAADMAFERD